MGHLGWTNGPIFSGTSRWDIWDGPLDQLSLGYPNGTSGMDQWSKCHWDIPLIIEVSGVHTAKLFRIYKIQ